MRSSCRCPSREIVQGSSTCPVPAYGVSAHRRLAVVCSGESVRPSEGVTVRWENRRPAWWQTADARMALFAPTSSAMAPLALPARHRGQACPLAHLHRGVGIVHRRGKLDVHNGVLYARCVGLSGCVEGAGRSASVPRTCRPRLCYSWRSGWCRWRWSACPCRIPICCPLGPVPVGCRARAPRCNARRSR